MGFEEILNLITSNGIGVACIIYFMFRDYKFMGKLNDTLQIIKTLCEKENEKERKED